ncbi:transketolase C-terminal domain-containing protein [Caldifermentibacillus hisashii]|uniref:transketolase family protein n=1 Tax=Caldifermentibacillus hisashii TaxID=996558 RepID=UPI0031FD0E90
MRYGDLIKQHILEDERFFVLTAENLGGIYYILEDIKKNYLDTGIAEQTMLGMAAGLALRNRIPIVHAISSFLLLRPFEFIRTDIGLPNLPVKLVGCLSGFLSEGNGPTHQCIEDVSLIRSIPNINIFCPADTQDMLLGLPAILKSESPYYIRYIQEENDVAHEKFEIGKAEIFGKGTDVAIITYGFLFREALKAKEKLESQGISVRVLNMRTLRPIDESAILMACKECNLVVTLEDHLIEGGIFTIISELLVRNQQIAKVLPLGLKKSFRPGLIKDILEYEGFSAEKITEKIISEM